MERATRQKRKSYSEAERTGLLGAYRTSGLSIKQWCTENNIGLSTLQRWARNQQKYETSQPQQTWVPVVTTNEENTEALSIQAGPFTIPVAANTNIKLLAIVLTVIRELC